MEKIINGVKYELVEINEFGAICEKCAFNNPPHGCKLGLNECLYIGNENKYWKIKDKK